MTRDYKFIVSMTASGKTTIAEETRLGKVSFSNQQPYFEGIGYFKSTPIIEIDSFSKQFLLEDVKDISLIHDLFNSFLDGDHFAKQTDQFRKFSKERKILVLHTNYYGPGSIFVLPKDVQSWYETHWLLADNDHFISKYDLEEFARWYNYLLDRYHSNKQNRLILLEEHEFLTDVWSKIRKEAKC